MIYRKVRILGSLLLVHSIDMLSYAPGILNEHLQSLLELNLSKPNKKSKVVLGVWDLVHAAAIKAALGFQCDADETVKDLIRGIRLHAPKLLKGMQADDLTKAQLGLGHS